MPNGLQQRYRTYGELLTELKARLGFVAQGPASTNNNVVLGSFLQEGHDFIFAKLKPQPARKKTTISLEQGSYLYDWHNDIDDENIEPELALSLWVKVSDTLRVKLEQGITEYDRQFTSRQYPTKYDTLNGQIELWPVPDQAYDMVVEYIAPKPRFSQAADRPGVPDRLILLYAIANGKAHYRHPDAQAAAATFNEMLTMAQGDQHENRRYFVNGQPECEETVTGSNGTYTMRVR